jgi:addiction module HigA family antidote
MPMKNPPHPGDFIRTEIIDPAGLSVTAAAALKVSRPTLSSLLNGKANLSGNMALRTEKGFGIERWTRLCGCSAPTTSPRHANARSESACSGFTSQPGFRHEPGAVHKSRSR